jgi:hypothetical protein
MEAQIKTLEAHYAYYRRCQLIRKCGEQCKAPAEKGASVCYAHGRQHEMTQRRMMEKQAVLEAAALEMRRKSRRECGIADLFLSFDGIQVTIAAVAQALIEDRIDCKTAGKLLWQLQAMAKLLRLCHKISPQISADRRGSEDCGETLIRKVIALTKNMISPNESPGWARAA